jgi:hypothetical protein
MKIGQPIADLEKSLRDYYGDEFEKLLAEKQKTAKTRLGALNALNRVTKSGETLEGAYMGNVVRRNRETKEVTSVSFQILNADGKVKKVRLHDTEFAQQLPPEPPKLAGVRWKNLDMTMVVSKDLVSYTTTPDTVLEVDDTIEFNLSELHTFDEAIEIKQNADGYDPFFTVLGEIVNVRVYDDVDSGVRSIRAEVQDLEGKRMSVKLEENLEDLFGEVDWIEDFEEVQQNLYHMPVLLNGRIFLYERGDGSQGAAFVVKGRGWIADFTKLPERVQQRIEQLALHKLE